MRPRVWHIQAHSWQETEPVLRLAFWKERNVAAVSELG